MNSFRVTLALRSPLGTPLVADTLFGHFCWGIVYHEGESALAEFLEAMGSDIPPLVISDPIPSGFWPMPVLPSPLSTDVDEAISSLSLGDSDVVARRDFSRELLRRPWIPHDSWSSLATSMDAKSVIRVLAKSASPAAVEPVAASVPHNTIHRLSGQTLEHGGLHFDQQLFPPGPLRYDVWASSTFAEDRLRDLFEWGLEGGYGRDGSAGKGHLTVEEVVACDRPAVANPNAVMALGVFAPRQTDPSCGLWKTDVRLGKLGGAFATDADDDQSGVFKYPVVLLQRGSVFLSRAPTPMLGRMVRNVHPTRPEVVTYARTLTLPICLTKEACQCLDTQ
ncbi:MAG: hypothetical protein H6819_06930 [Phycisphaerales bacterium]|nr:hypothetical protein [Phycisphaerales bacterium]MCB9855315.1 hypothetical protein [Phycisphaerales bacterium]MCB9862908.1 hypothetical protein [Phycisphaerales bacterium]